MDQGRTFIKGNLHNITNAQGQTVLVAQWQPLTTHGQQGLLQNSSGREATSFPLLTQHAGCLEELCLWPRKIHAHGIKAPHPSWMVVHQLGTLWAELTCPVLSSFPKGVGFLVWTLLSPGWEHSRVHLGPLRGSWFPTGVEWSRPWVKMLEDEEEAIIRAAYVPPRHTTEVRMADGVPGALSSGLCLYHLHYMLSPPETLWGQLLHLAQQSNYHFLSLQGWLLGITWWIFAGNQNFLPIGLQNILVCWHLQGMCQTEPRNNVREWKGEWGRRTIILNLMMKISLHLQLPEVRDNRCVSSACMLTEGDDTKRFC